jgi:hypothetical protein
MQRKTKNKIVIIVCGGFFGVIGEHLTKHIFSFVVIGSFWKTKWPLRWVLSFFQNALQLFSIIWVDSYGVGSTGKTK